MPYTGCVSKDFVVGVTANRGQPRGEKPRLYRNPPTSVARLFSYTRVDGETFKANGNTLGIDDYDSMVGRIGATAGLNCSQGRGGVYARFGVAHEFMGDGRFTAVNAAGTAADPIEVDGKDTWVEYAVGANFNITKQTYVWADLERTSGAEVDEDWRATILSLIHI